MFVRWWWNFILPKYLMAERFVYYLPFHNIETVLVKIRLNGTGADPEEPAPAGER